MTTSTLDGGRGKFAPGVPVAVATGEGDLCLVGWLEVGPGAARWVPADEDDVETLDGLFRDGPRTIRFGVEPYEDAALLAP